LDETISISDDDKLPLMTSRKFRRPTNQLTNEWTTKEDTPKLFFGALQPESEIDEYKSSSSSSETEDLQFD